LSSAEVSAPSKFRLNPFCLPSDTGCRFVLLIVTVFGSSLFVYNALALHKLSVQAYQGCLALGPSAAELSSSTGGPLELKDPSALIAKSQALASCVRGVQRGSAIWMFAGLAVLLLATLSIVWFIPTVKARRGRLVPLPSEDAPEVLASLESMSREAGLTRPPRFLWNPLNTASTGLAFGRPGDPCIALTGGLVTQFYTDQAAFRAVMLHELAHIRNGDVNKTYFAVATWYAFLAVALAPFLVAMSRNFLSGQLWRVLVLALLVYLSRTAVLRIRETYADVRASFWDTPAGALRRVIAALPQPKENFWQKWLRVHPTAAERSNALDNTENLFKVSFWETLFAGLAVGIAFPNFMLLTQTVVPGAIQVGILASLVFAALLSGIVGTRIWRTSLAALVEIGPTPRATQLGLALASGLLLGLKFSLSSAFSSELLTGAKNPTILWDFLLVIVLIAGSILFLRWEIVSASTWLTASLTARSPRATYFAAQIVSTAFLALVFGSLFVVWQVGQTYLSAGLTGFASLLALGFLVTLNQPAFSLVLFALWAFPLAAGLWRVPGSPSSSSWLSLEKSAATTPIPANLVSANRVPLQLNSALRLGLLGGAVFCILHILIRLAWHYTSPPAGASNESKFTLYYSQVLLGVLIQVVVVGVAAARIRRLPLLHGLLAAFTGACIMIAAFLVTNLVFGGTIGLTFASDLFQTIVNAGALASLPAGLLIAAFRTRADRRRQRDDHHQVSVVA
jgi:Zn-dependent protease with chaperone function